MPRRCSVPSVAAPLPHSRTSPRRVLISPFISRGETSSHSSPPSGYSPCTGRERDGAPLDQPLLRRARADLSCAVRPARLRGQGGTPLRQAHPPRTDRQRHHPLVQASGRRLTTLRRPDHPHGRAESIMIVAGRLRTQAKSDAERTRDDVSRRVSGLSVLLYGFVALSLTAIAATYLSRRAIRLNNCMRLRTQGLSARIPYGGAWERGEMACSLPSTAGRPALTSVSAKGTRGLRWASGTTARVLIPPTPRRKGRGAA